MDHCDCYTLNHSLLCTQWSSFLLIVQKNLIPICWNKKFAHQSIVSNIYSIKKTWEIIKYKTNLLYSLVASMMTERPAPWLSTVACWSAPSCLELSSFFIVLASTCSITLSSMLNLGTEANFEDWSIQLAGFLNCDMFGVLASLILKLKTWVQEGSS